MIIKCRQCEKVINGKPIYYGVWSGEPYCEECKPKENKCT